MSDKVLHNDDEDLARRAKQADSGDDPPQQPTGDTSTLFEKELEALINRYSQENLSDTPDFILAQYLCNTLRVFSFAVRRREQWYGRGPQQRLSPQTEEGR